MSAMSSRVSIILIHLICWGILLGFPFLFILDQDATPIDWMEYMKRSILVVGYCIVFYLNYFIFIPRLLFRERTKEFIGTNAAVILFVSVCLQLWQKNFVPMPHPPRHIPRISPFILFLIRDAFMMILTVGLSAAIRLNEKWIKTENARKDAERSRTETELKNLRNQLNPHFLLNTLNNIYALIAFDRDKAQDAVQELGRLLRYVLYDNQNDMVPLNREMDFIRNYISLMKIRLAPNVKLSTEFDISPESGKMIAPLIFISLIENAFKHGTSPGDDSFIRIAFEETDHGIRCEIVNSLHPKAETDKSGSGIGLEQVRRRLDLLYPGRYVWEYGVGENKTSYFSRLEISTAQSE